jgi:hypothetical protein
LEIVVFAFVVPGQFVLGLGAGDSLSRLKACGDFGFRVSVTRGVMARSSLGESRVENVEKLQAAGS